MTERGGGMDGAEQTHKGRAGGGGAGRNKVRGRQKGVSTLVWLSPLPDHLSYHLINSFLNDLSA